MPVSSKALWMPVNGCLDLQDVLRGLDQQQIHAASNQADGLLAKDFAQFVECDIGEVRVVGGGQFAGWADRAGHETRLGLMVLRRPRILICQAPRQFCGGLVDLDHPVLQSVFLHRDAVGAEGIGLDHIHAHFKERAVDLFHRFRIGDHQEIVAAVILLAAEFLGSQVLHSAGWCPWRRRRQALSCRGRRGSGGWCIFDSYYSQRCPSKDKQHTGSITSFCTRLQMCLVRALKPIRACGSLHIPSAWPLPTRLYPHNKLLHSPCVHPGSFSSIPFGRFLALHPWMLS